MACNNLLGNEPGSLGPTFEAATAAPSQPSTTREDASIAAPTVGWSDSPKASPTNGDSVAPGTAGRDEVLVSIDASAPNPDATIGADAATMPDPRPTDRDASTDGTAFCGQGEQRCDSRCVGIGDPDYGCGSQTCAPCNTPNATAACSAMKCIIAYCNNMFADCNKSPIDGCETYLADSTHCGACNRACAAGETCAAGVCSAVDTGTVDAGSADAGKGDAGTVDSDAGDNGASDSGTGDSGT